MTMNGLSESEFRVIAERQAGELAELREQQAATAEVLRVISQSPPNLERALSMVLQKAAELCGAGPAQIFQRDGDIYRYAVSRILDPAYRAIEERARIGPGRSTLVGRVAQERRTVHIDDAWADPEYGPREEVRLGNVRSMLGIPLLRGVEMVGIMVLGRNEVKPFSIPQISLVKTFADQAVIAIENARLFAEAQARTAELENSLERLRETQHRLVQSEKLASLGQLVAGVAHEINTPIGNAITVASTLEEELRRLTKSWTGNAAPTHALARLSDGTRIVSGNLRRAADLVRNFRQIATAHGENGPARFLAKPLLDKLAGRFGFSSHDIVVDCPAQLEIDGYPQLLTQVVESLVRNCGIHAFPEERAGTIGVTAALSECGEVVVISVEDDGCGIGSDHLERVFDPFFTTARGRGHLGLGLHIAHSSVAAMKGHISVSSHVGRGTRFTLILPR